MPKDMLDPTAGVVDTGVPEPTPSGTPGITVDLEAPVKEQPKSVSLEDVLAELKEAKKINQSLGKQVAASYRITESLRRELDGLKRGVVTSDPVQKPLLVPEDETQRMAELKPWEKPLRNWAKEEAERLYQEKETIRQQEQAEINRQQELSRSQQLVISKYPSLGEDGSELTESYLEIVNAHPEWHRDPFGPVRAMLEMEKVAQEQGILLPVVQQMPSQSNKEVVRRARANAASLPPGRPIQTSGKIQLTKEQEDFAKSNRIPVETYAKMVSGLNSNGVVEIK